MRFKRSYFLFQKFKKLCICAWNEEKYEEQQPSGLIYSKQIGLIQINIHGINNYCTLI